MPDDTWKDTGLVREVVKFSAAYCREAVIELRNDIDCDVCGKKGLVGMSSDSSMGEYGACQVCCDCMYSLALEAKSKQEPTNG